ncbi:MAG: hypothetical protein GY945_00845 [Rhodobacteraceae bacterium]|nr:hypothetical protein [Paracoccaceae bacterium]
MKPIYTLGIFALASALGASGAFGQTESSNRVAANTAWSVFVETDPKECWAVSTPKESVNTKNDRPVAVNRGTILMMVSYRPDQNVMGEVYFTGGYPFADGSSVELTISGTSFQLFTQGEDSWPATPEDDARIITAMKRGADAVMVAHSSRGTKTEDTFSLLGFTAAVEDAAKRCDN